MSLYVNTSAEECVLYALHAKPEARPYANDLIQDDFTDAANKHLFNTIKQLIAEKKIPDVPAIAECGGDSDVSTLTKILTSDARLRDFQYKENINILRRATLQREAQRVISESLQRLDDEPAEAVIDGLRQNLRQMSSQGGQVISMHDILISTYTELEARCLGERRSILTGIAALDDATGGLYRGELTIIGARPAVGKSAVGLQIALAASESGARVLMVSQEMSVEQIGMRMFARDSKISVSRLRDMKYSSTEERDRRWTILQDGLSKLGGNENLLGMFPAQNIEQLRATAQRLKDGQGLDVLIVDYLQLLRTRQKFEADFLRLGYISQTLKLMAVELDIAIVALAQVGRASEGDMPTLAELRGSGDLEQDADNVLFLHTPDEYDSKWVHEDDRALFNTWQSMGLKYMAMHIAKARQSETRTRAVLFDPAHMLFKSIDRD